MADAFLDRYFFRLSNVNLNPICTDGNIINPADTSLPCRFCIVGFNPPLTPVGVAAPLSCLSEDKSYSELFIAFWNFDEKWEEPTKQTIEDKSGNGYIMYKGTPADAEPNEPFKLPG